MTSPLDRPPVLRPGALDAHAIPSGAGHCGIAPDTRWADGCRPPVVVAAPQPAAQRVVATVEPAAGPAPAPATPTAPAKPNRYARRVALGQCRHLAWLHRITLAEIATPADLAERAAAITAVRGLIDRYQLTAEQLFSRA